MSRYRRPDVTGARIFFTVTLADRESDLLLREIDRLRWAVAVTLRERPVGVEAWVVLPDHMHCIWSLPSGDRDYATRWRVIKARFSRQLPCAPRRGSHVRRGERAIWQRRYWEHHIRNDTDMAHHLRYCWENPVKHGLVASAAEWPFSTVHREIAAGNYP